MEEGDFRGAVRLACSGDSIAEVNNATIGALRSKHPAAHPDTSLPSAPKEEALEAALEVSEREVSQAIRSFPRGSAGGPDGLRPQHLVDMTSMSAGAGGSYCCVLTTFTNFLLTGEVHVEIRPLLFGASLVALNKKDGGVRPVAVSCTLRQLVAKTASMAVILRMSSLLYPLQLGYGTPLEAEAAVHSSRLYLKELPPDHVLVKLDFRNAFNTAR